MLYRIVNGSITLGNHTVLEEINFQINKGEKIGIVGRNGVGKSTFLKGILNEVEIEEGISDDNFRIDKTSDFSIGYVKQNVSFDKDISMIDYLLQAYEDIIFVEKKIEKLNKKMCEKYDDKVVEEYSNLLDRYRNIGGYEYKKEYQLAVKMFGFGGEDFSKKMGDFSLGQITKIAFIRLLLSKPDLLLLDEPTNHLDMNMVEWLEGYLKKYNKSMIVVSHDRMFLDTVCNTIYEIEFGSLKRYAGNYSFYVKKKEEDYNRLVRDYERQQREIERLERIADRFRYKPSKAKMAMSKLKQIEHMVKIDKPMKENRKSFASWSSVEYESYRNVLKVKDLLVGYDRVLSKVSFSIERGCKLGIIGRNGVGKSTLLKTLMGEICQLGGKYVFGNMVKIGYFDQNLDNLDENSTVYEEIEREFPRMGSYEIRKMLGAFDFSGDDVFLLVRELSGGEKVRLSLCKIFGNRPNVLILDEPTNHLDIINKETIQKMLMSYKGTILMVSHDRYLLNQVCDKMLVMNGEESCFYNCGFDDYVKQVKNDGRESKKEVGVNHNAVVKKKEVCFFKERSKLERKMRKIEDEIFILEKKREELNHHLLEEDIYSDLGKAKEVDDKIKKIDEEIESKMKSWEKIGEIIL